MPPGKRGRARRVDDPSLGFESAAAEAAREAFDRAEYSKSKAILAATETNSSLQRGKKHLLLARIARVESDFTAMYDAARLAASERLPLSAALMARALWAAASRRLDLFAEASRLAERISIDIERCSVDDARDASYLLAVAAWEAGDYVQAERFAKRTIEAQADSGDNEALLGWIAIKCERYERAGVHFASPLRRYRVPGSDLRMRARALQGAAVIAFETADRKLGRRVQTEFATIVWPETLRQEEFEILTCLRFIALLEGDVQEAWFTARRAVVIAPRPSFAAIGETNAASASRLLGDAEACVLQFGRAWQTIRQIRWATADAGDRVALTNFALEAAQEMPAEARKAITIYRSSTDRSPVAR